MSRARHQRKELEAILQECEARGWRVEKAKGGYFKVKCRCEERHMRTVHLTPSDPNHGKNLVASPLLVLEGHRVKYRVTFEGLAVSGERRATPFDADGLEAQLDRVMEELVKRQAGDATVSGTVAKGEVEVSVLVEAPDLESALDRGQAVVRAALKEAAPTGSVWAFDWTSVKAMRIESLARATG